MMSVQVQGFKVLYVSYVRKTCSSYTLGESQGQPRPAVFSNNLDPGGRLLELIDKEKRSAGKNPESYEPRSSV